MYINYHNYYPVYIQRMSPVWMKNWRNFAKEDRTSTLGSFSSSTVPKTNVQINTNGGQWVGENALTRTMARLRGGDQKKRGTWLRKSQSQRRREVSQGRNVLKDSPVLTSVLFHSLVSFPLSNIRGWKARLSKCWRRPPLFSFSLERGTLRDANSVSSTRSLRSVEKPLAVSQPPFQFD